MKIYGFAVSWLLLLCMILVVDDVEALVGWLDACLVMVVKYMY